MRKIIYAIWLVIRSCIHSEQRPYFFRLIISRLTQQNKLPFQNLNFITEPYRTRSANSKRNNKEALRTESRESKICTLAGEIRPWDICRAESAPSMWSLASVKIQIENHLANLPVVRSVNKFRFTRVGGLHVMDPREARRFNLHKSRPRAYARYIRAQGRESPRNIPRHRNGSFYRSIERKPACGIYGRAICWTEGNVCANVNKDAAERWNFEVKIGGFHMSRLRYVIYALLTNRWSIFGEIGEELWKRIDETHGGNFFSIKLYTICGGCTIKNYNYSWSL